VKIKTMIALAALGCGLLMVGGGVWAMSSGSYAINWDVIAGGGEPASSANYAMIGTIGQAAAERSLSTSYGLWPGYWHPTRVGFQLSLKAGWNMVSIPVTPADNSTSVVFPGVVGVFTWNATDGSYYEPEVIDPEQGYWVAVTEDTTITVNGTPVDTWTTDIKAGWNMIGSANMTVSIADPNDNPDSSVIPPAYWWDPEGKSYVVTTDVEPGKGYWIPSINDCVLTL
jgi:hypothetical protein